MHGQHTSPWRARVARTSTFPTSFWSTSQIIGFLSGSPNLTPYFCLWRTPFWLHFPFWCPPNSPYWVPPLPDTVVKLIFSSSDPAFFSACFHVVEYLFTSCNCCCVGSYVHGILPQQTALCGGTSSPNGLGHLFDQFSIVLDFALFFSCFGGLVWVTHC